MSRRIFLDVGAHNGETLTAVVDPAFSFDRIVCFEPVWTCWPEILAIKYKNLIDHRLGIVRVEQFGLWNQTCEKPLFGFGNAGASMWKKSDHRKYNQSELCQFRRATDWFKDNIKTGDTVFLKLNCEGAECDILDDLLDSGEFNKVSYCMVDFDVRKISSQKHRETEIRARFLREGIRFPRWAYTKQVMKGATHQERIKNWIRMVEEVKQ